MQVSLNQKHVCGQNPNQFKPAKHPISPFPWWCRKIPYHSFATWDTFAWNLCWPNQGWGFAACVCLKRSAANQDKWICSNAPEYGHLFGRAATKVRRIHCGHSRVYLVLITPLAKWTASLLIYLASVVKLPPSTESIITWLLACFLKWL